MAGNAFDSNILIYIIADDPSKAERGRFLIAEGGTISVQVLNEIVSVSRRKLRLEWPIIVAYLKRLKLLLNVVPVDVAVHNRAVALSMRFNLSFYDAAIVAAALLADCDTLWSEDMHDGLVVDGRLTIRNPFRLS
ncbi:PIN domain-containing protein [Sphingomonas sp. PB4P5]|uniref:PIN domain-containing protein n=1 Tax=Parasphingomonas puruogangriensis TaxID=3096155 RepID=UPI002FC830DD